MLALLLSLPDEVLKSILAHVPLKNRLGSCCRVHTRLHAAAVAATQQLSIGSWLSPLPPEHAQAALHWLSLYGQHVTRLELFWLQQPQPLTQLPCPNLLDLRSIGTSMQLGPTADGRPGVLWALTKLTRLELPHDSEVDATVMHSLSRLANLRHLHIAGSVSAATLDVAKCLTHLGMRIMPFEYLCQLSALTALQELVCTGEVGFVVGSNVPGLALPSTLTKLELCPETTEQGGELALLSAAPTGLQALQIDLGGGPAPPELMLSCLPRLQCLTQLALYASGDEDWPPPGPVYSALTASSSLVSLWVDGNLPAGVWPFVFPATHQLLHLTCLKFGVERGDAAARWAFGAADLAALVGCCPGLCAIDDLSLLLPGPHVSELCKLTALTKLHVYGNGEPFDTMQGLAALTQLRVLVADFRSPVVSGMAALLPLTSLTALTSIFCSWCDEDDAWEAGMDAQAGSAPDVWLQLLEHCAAEDPDCHPTVLRGLAQQLAEQQALTVAQAQRISGVEAQLSRQQQRNELLQQQHVAAQQVASEQDARIAALEGQLQQLLQHLL